MNSYFKELLQLLNGVPEVKLVEALYILRAPKNLVAIVPLCRAFKEMRTRYPELRKAPSFGLSEEAYAQGLELLDRIAALEVDDDYFSGRCLQSRKNQWTPMRPYTGDSVIAELLLVTTLEQSSQEHFTALAAWLIRQVQYFHSQRVSINAYEHYLLGNDSRLMKAYHGSRPYNSLRELQKLAARSERLQFIASALDAFDETSSFKLALLTSLDDASSSTERRRLEQYISPFLSVEPNALAIFAADIAALLPRSWQLLLFSIWESRLSIITRPGGGGGGSASPRRVERNELIYGTALTEAFVRVGNEGDASHSGIVTDFFERDAAVEDPESDDPDEEEQREPVFSLFLSDQKDLLTSFYASKSIQSSIERHNAQLPWTRDLLSAQAVKAVVSHITRPKEGIKQFDVLARLAIALCLITGRAISEVTTPMVTITDEQPTRDNPVIINKARRRLLLFAAQPKLAEKHQNPPFCAPSQAHISLDLPGSWWPLISLLEVGKNKWRTNVARICSTLLNELPSNLRVTAKSLRNTFIQKLLQITNGDLGVQKVITDGAEANIENIIHYASYSAGYIESVWHEAVEAMLKETVPQQIEPKNQYGHVGTPHSFDVNQLHSAFGKLQQTIARAVASHNLPETLHSFSLYMALRLGLATAGRSTKLPFPRVYVANGWALVTDKSRVDGSTDRILPLTHSLLKQIAIYIDVVRGLAPLQPELTPLQRDERGLYLQLVVLDEDENLVPYQPKHLREHKDLKGLPPNWGRKVVRSVSPQLLGRYKDIGLGHWVRGRHPWEAMSTLNTESFASAWIATQQQLERQLGLKEVHFPGLQLSRQRIVRSYPEATKRPVVTPTKQRYETDEIRMRLQISAPHYLNALEKPKTKNKPGIALEMVRLMLRRHVSELTTEQLTSLAEGACLYVRENYQIPLFANKPRAIFANQHVLNFTGLQALAYFEEHYAKAFNDDLAVLPKKEWADEVKADVAKVELGRLVLIGIWRLGLNRWVLIDEWLKCLWRGKPILAAKELRYMSFRVKAENREDTMRRTVLLDDFTAAYLIAEREDLITHVLPQLFEKSYMSAGRRRQTADNALSAYFRQFGSAKPLTLSHIMSANVQRIMLTAAPLLAAYSRGAFLTEDFGDDVIRRLQGLQPNRQGASNRAHARHKEELVGNAGVPQDVIAASNLIKKMSEIDTNCTSTWLAMLKKIEPATPLERLVCAFAVWLAGKAQKESTVFSNRAKGTFVNRVAVVAHVLLGEYGAVESTSVVDESLLDEWFELGRAHFRERTNQGAWFQFYHFLKQYPLESIGWCVGELGKVPEQQVSARVFSVKEEEEIKRRVVSAASGIGNAGNRQIAGRVLNMVATYGVRRGEAVALRKVDYQQNLLRIQPYGEHQLKTASADRVLPLSIAPAEMAEWVNRAMHTNVTHLLANEETGEVGEENFFHALNAMLKEVCQDDSMGMHHFRHTVASRWLVSLLKKAVGLPYLEQDIPWLVEWEISDALIKNFLNNEMDGGQGLRILSAMLGHLHPTTTLRHYVHSLGFCLYGALNKIDKLSIVRSFERRVASRATIKRWAKDARESTAHIDGRKQRLQAKNRVIRTHIERRFKQQGISVDERSLEPIFTPLTVLGNTENEKEISEAISFQYIESLDHSLRYGASLVEGQTIGKAARGLHALAAIPSGRRGSTGMRHPLEPNKNGIPLPKALAAGTAQKAANNLCVWLSALKEKDEETFFWLLEKWMHHSERERGRMTLEGKAEIEKAEQFDGLGLVEIQVETVAQVKDAKRMRIKCLDEKGELITRDTQAVRWVMSYVLALAM